VLRLIVKREIAQITNKGLEMYFEVWLKELSIRRNKGGWLGNSRTYNDNVTIHFMRNSSSENVRDLKYYRSCKIRENW
jgi:hypothetical protein